MKNKLFLYSRQLQEDDRLGLSPVLAANQFAPQILPDHEPIPNAPTMTFEEIEMHLQRPENIWRTQGRI